MYKKIKLPFIICALVICTVFIIIIGYKGVVEYYECHALPSEVVMRQLKRANGDDIFILGKTISPAYNENGNIVGYAETIAFCE